MKQTDIKTNAAARGAKPPRAASKRGSLAASKPGLRPPDFSDEQIALAMKYATHQRPARIDPRLSALVNDLIDRVADKWTMLVLEVLTEHGVLRFSRLAEKVSGVSQKMLTQTLRQMERDGLVIRTIWPVVPPRVEYRLTSLGLSLGGAFCGVWVWASDNLKQVEKARAVFDAKALTGR